MKNAYKHFLMGIIGFLSPLALVGLFDLMATGFVVRDLLAQLDAASFQLMLEAGGWFLGLALFLRLVLPRKVIVYEEVPVNYLGSPASAKDDDDVLIKVSDNEDGFEYATRRHMKRKS